MVKEKSDAALYIGNKRPQAELLGLEVHLMQSVQQGVYLRVVYHRQNSRTHGRPRMAAEVRVARLRATPLHTLQISEAAAVETIQQGDDAFVISLVECD